MDLINLYKLFTNKDKNDMDNAKNELENLLNKNLNLFLYESFNLLFKNIQGLSKKIIMIYVNSKIFKDENLFKSISFDNFNFIKNNCFNFYLDEANQYADLKYYSNFIGDFASKYIETFTTNEVSIKELWPDFFENLFKLLNTNNENNIIFYFNILESISYKSFSKIEIYHNNIYLVFEKFFQSDNNNIFTEAIDTYVSIISDNNYKLTKKFYDLLKYILLKLKIFLDAKNSELISHILGNLIEIIEERFILFKPFITDLVFLLTISIQLPVEIEYSINKQTIDLAFKLTENFTKFFKDNIDPLKRIIEIIYMGLISIDDEITNEWMNPPDGFNDEIDEEENEIVKNGISYIDIIIQNIGKEIVLPILNETYQSLINNNNWKILHASLLVLSQIGEYMDENLDDLNPILNTVSQNINNQNPKIRYACLHLIGQYSDDLSPKFQSKFHSKILLIVLPLLNDRVPRVISHTLSCLTNFLENCPHDYIKDQEKYLFDKIMYLLENGTSYIKESAIPCLSAFIQCVKDNLSEYYYDNIKLKLIYLIKSIKEEKFEMIKNEAIECLSILMKLVNKEKLNDDNFSFMNLLIDILDKETNILSLDSMKKNYLITAINRILTTMSKENVNKIYNYLLETVIKKASKLSKKNDHKYTLTSNAEETKIILDLIKNLIKLLDVNTVLFKDKIFFILNIILENIKNQRLLLYTLSLIEGLISKIKDFYELKKEEKLAILSKFLIIYEKKNNSGLKIRFLRHISNIILLFDEFLDTNEINNLYNFCIKEIKEADKRMSVNKLDIYELEEYIDDINAINQLNEMEKKSEEDVIFKISNIIGSIIKNHKEKFLNHAQDLYNNYILFSLKQEKVSLIKFSLNTINYFIKNKIYNEEIINISFNNFKKFINHNDLFIRIISLNGFSNIINVPNFDFNVKELILNIQSSLTLNDQIKKKTLGFKLLKDYVNYTYGNILIHKNNFLNNEEKQELIIYWVKNMPYVYLNKKDHNDLNNHINHFCNIYLNYNDIFKQFDNNSLFKIIKRFIYAYDSLEEENKINFSKIIKDILLKNKDLELKFDEEKFIKHKKYLTKILGKINN